MLGLNTTLPDHKGALLEEKESLTALEILEWNCSRRVTWSSCCWSTNLVEMETYSHPQRDRKEQLILLQWWHILINYCYIFLVVSINKYTFIIYIYICRDCNKDFIIHHSGEESTCHLAVPSQNHEHTYCRDYVQAVVDATACCCDGVKG